MLYFRTLLHVTVRNKAFTFVCKAAVPYEKYLTDTNTLCSINNLCLNVEGDNANKKWKGKTISGHNRRAIWRKVRVVSFFNKISSQIFNAIQVS